MARSGAGRGWVAGGIDDNQPVLGCLLEDVVDAVKYGVKLIHGVAKPLEVGLEMIEGFVVA